MFKVTTAFKKIIKLRKRYKIIQGSSGASKTWSILQMLLLLAIKQKLTISVVSENLPKVKRTVLRDFKNIIEPLELGINLNKTDLVYTFDNGSIIEFFSIDDPGKVKGARRDILYIDEAEAIGYGTFTQLDIRTKKFVILSYNPSYEFWAFDELLYKKPELCDHLILTYLDNEELSNMERMIIESRRDEKVWFTVYGLGQLHNSLSGLIYPEWGEFTELPKKYHRIVGLDSGFNPDPTAAIDIYIDGFNAYLKELIHATDQLNSDIAGVILNDVGLETELICDSADPKLISELGNYGIMAMGAKKGAGSVLAGIKTVRKYRLHVHKDSHNIKEAFKKYRQKKNKDDKLLPQPDHAYSHIPDAIRYGLSYYDANYVY